MIKSRVVAARILWNNTKQSLWIRISNLRYIYEAYHILRNIWIWFKLHHSFFSDHGLEYFCSFIFKSTLQKYIIPWKSTWIYSAAKFRKLGKMCIQWLKKKKITQDFFERSHNKCLGSEYIFGNCLLWSSWDHRLLTIFWNLVIICQLPNLFWKC